VKHKESDLMRRMVLLTGGVTNVGTAKTAVNLLRYKPEEVVAVLDPANSGKSAQELFGVGGKIPVIKSLSEAPDGNMVTIGIAPAGGKLSAELRGAVLEGIARGMEVLSGLHTFLSDDPEIAQAAEKRRVRIVDVRKNNEREVAQRKNINEKCLRIHTVGHDCNVGKMVVSVELARALGRAGHDAKFVATGQTGIMIEGDGCPVDAVVVDFINGAAEKLILQNQHHEIMVVEGQGSIVHPRYSAVTLGLLHGCVPDGLILCYEMGRNSVYGMDEVRLPDLRRFKGLYETMANVMHPCKVIGIGINGRKFSDDEVRKEKERIQNELGLPAADVLRHGAEDLVKAVLKLKKSIGK
jgi:uncharacterized NAD-dependent epimerase/dehydratase family protein